MEYLEQGSSSEPMYALLTHKSGEVPFVVVVDLARDGHMNCFCFFHCPPKLSTVTVIRQPARSLFLFALSKSRHDATTCHPLWLGPSTSNKYYRSKVGSDLLPALESASRTEFTSSQVTGNNYDSCQRIHCILLSTAKYLGSL